ncbi:MAG: right-handed parallel beta-helix repeat-containing protein, partial [Bacteroidota bacterium]
MKTLIRFSIVAFIFAIGYFNPNLNAAMSGDYYVGSNSGPSGPADYSTLSAAFSALETQGKSGDVTFWITSDLSVSSAQDLGVVSGSGTIYIRPYQSERTISGSVSNGGIIEFDGTDDFVVDGSINGSGRHLIIKNNTNGAGIHLNGTSTVYSTDWEIKNCEIFAGGTSSSHNICIALSGSNAYSNGYRHSDGLIENNILKRGYYGIRARAASSLYEMDNIVIKGNVFGDKDDWGSSDRIRYYGIYSYYNEKWDVLDNEMYVERYPMYFRYNYDLVTIKNNIAKGHDYYPYLYFMYDGVDIQDNYFEGSGTNMYGLYVRSNNASYEPCIISNNEITKSDYYGLYIYYADNVEIENNYIHKIHANTTGYLSGMYLNRVEDGLVKNNRIEDIKNNTTSNFGGAAYGIYVWGGSTSLTYTEDLEIFQNFIKNLRSNGNVQTSTSQFENPIGIYIRGGEDYYIHHNTIDMGTSFNDDSKQGAWSACVLAGYYKTQGIRMKNNILKNDMIGNGTKAYGFALRPYFSGTYSVTEMDHNVYDLTGAGAAGNVAHWDGDDYAFLSDWTDFSGADVNSAQTEVFLMSDGHLDGGSVGDEDLEVPKISGIDHDMDGELRQSTTTAGID